MAVLIPSSRVTMMILMVMMVNMMMVTMVVIRVMIILPLTVKDARLDSDKARHG